GAVYNRTELEAIAEVCVKYNLLVISDEIYEKLIYDGEEHYSIAQVSDEIKQRTVVINGVSKAFAMTGWRLGYAAGPIDIIKAATRLQEHTTSCVTSITQKASVAALTEDDGSVEKMRLEFDRRRTFLVNEINRIPHVSCALPKGAFYTMANVGYYIKNNRKGIADTNDLCVYLLENAHIAVVTGSAFGMENYVRFSYANSLENLQEGLLRFKKGLESLL
ncbi:MAG: aminotransferase class I/II-fold pyridoxal phosphate-dependent enzyme, partial [Candidatus Marinimicrobia bacterium]|nr:aminotransferase class I/II-fold pyridoxal phosphate-dependent enzyme [Candidatus Neomarinimicrobiota bacterium]